METTPLRSDEEIAAYIRENYNCTPDEYWRKHRFENTATVSNREPLREADVSKRFIKTAEALGITMDEFFARYPQGHRLWSRLYNNK